MHKGGWGQRGGGVVRREGGRKGMREREKEVGMEGRGGREGLSLMEGGRGERWRI